MKRRLPTAFASLAFRDFTLIWSSQFISSVGTQIQTVALGWLVYDITGSAALLGGIALARAIPTIFLSLFGGVLADQVDRRRLLLISQSALALFSALLAIAIQIGRTDVWLLYLFAILTAAMSSVSVPTTQAFIPELVDREHLTNALTLNVLSWNLAAVLGPALGGTVIGVLGVAAAYWLDAASFFVVVGALIAMRSRHESDSLPRRGFDSLIEGLVFVRERPVLWQLMLIDFLAVLFASRFGLLPVFAESILDVGAQGLGLLYSAVSFGAVFGSLLFTFLPQPERPGKLIALTIVAYGAVLAGFGQAHSFVLALVLLAISGALDAVSSALREIARQLATPDSLRGRVGALSTVFSIGGPRLGDFQAGILASIAGAGNAMLLGGVACALMAIASHRWARPLWAYRGEELTANGASASAAPRELERSRSR